MSESANKDEEAGDSGAEVTGGLRHFLEEESKKDNFSGSVLVARNGQVALQFSSGLVNKEAGIKSTPETKFNIGSLNKMFTAVAVAQLVEAGKLDFDDQVGKYLPEYPSQTVREGVTIHQLLTHTAGLGHYMSDISAVASAEEKPKSIDDFVSLFKDKPLPFKPGEGFHYSGDGYELLGAIVESVTGETYYDYIRENIFEKAGMNDSDFIEVDPDSLDPEVAVGYKKTKDSFFTPTDEPPEDNLKFSIKGSAAGGTYSTVGDMLKFSQALLGNQLLSSEMTTLVMSPKVEVESKDGQTLHYGYGFQIVDFNGKQRIGHGGASPGVSARFDMYPELGYTVIVLSNYDRPTAFRVAEKATELIISD